MVLFFFCCPIFVVIAKCHFLIMGLLYSQFPYLVIAFFWSGYTTFMTWQAITEEESVPVVKSGDTMVKYFLRFLILHYDVSNQTALPATVHLVEKLNLRLVLNNLFISGNQNLGTLSRNAIALTTLPYQRINWDNRSNYAIKAQHYLGWQNISGRIARSTADVFY